MLASLSATVRTRGYLSTTCAGWSARQRLGARKKSKSQEEPATASGGMTQARRCHSHSGSKRQNKITTTLPSLRAVLACPPWLDTAKDGRGKQSKAE